MLFVFRSWQQKRHDEVRLFVREASPCERFNSSCKTQPTRPKSAQVSCSQARPPVLKAGRRNTTKTRQHPPDCRTFENAFRTHRLRQRSRPPGRRVRLPRQQARHHTAPVQHQTRRLRLLRAPGRLARRRRAERGPESAHQSERRASSPLTSYEAPENSLLAPLAPFFLRAPFPLSLFGGPSV